MLLAQLHHKVPRVFEGMEDVLTASTIGALRYLPAGLAAAILSGLAGLDGVRGDLQIDLWPQYRTPAGFRAPPPETPPPDGEEAQPGGTEPDAVIRAGNWLVFVEAKYRSPLDPQFDQLGRQFVIGFREAERLGLRFRLLAITANTLEPEPGGSSLCKGVQEAIRQAHARAPEGPVEALIDAAPRALRWTNWQALGLLLDNLIERARRENGTPLPEHACRLVEDILRLLQGHGLVPYKGDAVEKVMAAMAGSGIADADWAAPVAYRYRVVTSLAPGWATLRQSDLAPLHPLAWSYPRKALAAQGNREPSSLSAGWVALGGLDLTALQLPTWDFRTQY